MDRLSLQLLAITSKDRSKDWSCRFVSVLMEGVLIGAAPRVRVLPTASAIQGCMRNLRSKHSSILGISLRRARRVSPLCYAIPEEESMDALTSSRDHIANSIEVIEWESGKSLDGILESQGIRIRRHPPTRSPTKRVEPLELSSENKENTPRNILEKIIWDKDVEATELKERKPFSIISKDLENAPPVRDFVGALRASYKRTGVPALIAEVKKASPSRGVLREDFNPCPLLCKEFVIDAHQIYYARSKGADAILLIAAVLTDLDIKYMNQICWKLGIAALVEVHNEREMDRVLSIEGIQLIGINNRDLETFDVDISITKRLLEGERGHSIRRKGIIVVGESGLFTPEDIAYVQNAGVNAVLVGESLIKEEDPGKGITGLFGKDISD